MPYVRFTKHLNRFFPDLKEGPRPWGDRGRRHPGAGRAASRPGLRHHDGHPLPVRRPGRPLDLPDALPGPGIFGAFHSGLTRRFTAYLTACSAFPGQNQSKKGDFCIDL